MEVIEKLDEKGFVFLDGLNRPIWVTMWRDEPWAMKWLDRRKKWVTMQKVSDPQIKRWRKHKMREDWAEMYHEQHRETQKRENPFYQ